MSLLPISNIQKTVEQEIKKAIPDPKEALNNAINGKPESKEQSQEPQSSLSIENATKIPNGGAVQVDGRSFTVKNGRPFIDDVDMNGGPFGPKEVRQASKDGFTAFAKDKEWYVVQDQKPATAAALTSKEVKPGEAFTLGFGEKTEMNGLKIEVSKLGELNIGGLKNERTGIMEKVDIAGTLYYVSNEGAKGWGFIPVNEPAPATQSPAPTPTSSIEKLELGRSEYRIPFGKTVEIAGKTYVASEAALTGNGTVLRAGGSTVDFDPDTPSLLYKVSKEKDAWVLTRTDAQQSPSPAPAQPTTPATSQGAAPAMKAELGQAQYDVPLGKTLQIGDFFYESTANGLVEKISANGSGTPLTDGVGGITVGDSLYKVQKSADGWTLVKSDKVDKPSTPAPTTPAPTTPAQQELKPQGHSTPVEPPMGPKPVPSTPPEAPQPKKAEGHKLEEGKPYTLSGLTLELKGGKLHINGRATNLQEGANEVLVKKSIEAKEQELAGYIVYDKKAGSVVIYGPSSKPPAQNGPLQEKPAAPAQPNQGGISNITRTTGIVWEDHFSKEELALGKGPVHDMIKYAEANRDTFMRALQETQKQYGSFRSPLQLLMTYTDLTVWSKLAKK